MEYITDIMKSTFGSFWPYIVGFTIAAIFVALNKKF
jgi:hypothetical protein